MKIFIVAMPASGNLGDDLISQLLVHHLINKFSPSEIGVLSGEYSFQYKTENNTPVKIFKLPNKRSFNNYFSRKKAIRNYITNCDLIVIGGGGLLQDTHYSFTIHRYLKYINYAKRKIMFLGIGVGPVKRWFNKTYLKNILNIKNILIQVREVESYNLLRNLGVRNEININSDIVEGSVITVASKKHLPDVVTLGCSIRKWKDLNIETIGNFILRLVNENAIKKIHFFVFEDTKENHEEKIFSLQIINFLKNKSDLKFQLFVYGEIDNDVFYAELNNVNFALASRLHANIIWQKLSVPVIPISYAPKVYSLYKKYNLNAQSFSNLITSTQPEFFFIPDISKDNSYTIPPAPSDNVHISFSAKLLFLLFNIYEFASSSVNSFLLRIRR